MTQPVPPGGVIELDPEADVDPAPGRRRRLRRPVATGVVLACLLTLAGSTTSPVELNEPRWTARVSLAGYVIGRQNLYVTEPGAVSIAALSPSTGARRWRLPIGQPLIDVVEVSPAVTAVVTRQPTPNDETGRQTTATFVASASGERLATAQGLIVGGLPGGLVLFASNATARAPDGPAARWVDLRAVDPRTGRAAWRIPSIQEGGWFTGTDPTGRITFVATVTDADAVQLRDPATGAVAGTVDGPAAGLGGAMIEFGDVLVVMRVGADSVDLAAYGMTPPTTRRLWRSSLAYAVERGPAGGWPNASPCGDLLCLHFNGGTSAIEPRTGRVRYRLPMEIWSKSDAGPVMALPTTDDSGRMAYLIDVTTGSILTRIGTYDNELVDWPDSNGRLLLSRSGTSRTEFTIVDARGHERRVGTIDGVDLNCAARGPTLACAEASGLLRVWRLPD